MIENIFCKKLSLPIPFNPVNLNSYQIQSKTTRESPFQSDILNVEFIDWLKQFDLFVNDCRVFNAPPLVRYDPHKDISFIPDLLKLHSDCVKINVVYNSVNSKMIWYKLKKNMSPKVVTNRVGDKINVYPIDILDQIYEAETDSSSMLINGMEIHTLHNGTTHRLCFSMPLFNLSNRKRISWDKAVNIFKDYLV
jgi:hypothetical protein